MQDEIIKVQKKYFLVHRTATFVLLLAIVLYTVHEVQHMWNSPRRAWEQEVRMRMPRPPLPMC